MQRLNSCTRVRHSGKRTKIQTSGLHNTASDFAVNAATENLDALAANFFQHVASADAVTHFSTALYEQLAGAGLNNIEEAHIRTISDAIAGTDLQVAAQAAASVPDATMDIAAESGQHASILGDMWTAALPASVDLLSAGALHGVAGTSTIFADLGTTVGQRIAAAGALDAAAAGSISHSLAAITDALGDALHAEAGDVARHSLTLLNVSMQQLLWAMNGDSSAMLDAVGSAHAAVHAAAGQLQPGYVGIDALVKVAVAAVALIAVSMPSSDAEQPPDSLLEDLPSRYDPAQLEAHFAARPVRVLQRQAEVAGQLSTFFTAVLADWRTGLWEANMPRRAVWLRTIVEGLGPAYVKIAQALSTRIDMVPEPYLEQFARLQDSVAPFPTAQALELLEVELGRPVSDVFADFSAEPVASASLGQVYRARLHDAYGAADVAVKVQRPGVMESVALDVLLMRKATVLFSKIPQFSDGWAEVLDDWAGRFFQEMDYQAEAYNMLTFKQQMASLDGIVVADVYPEWTSRRVIVSGWVVGEKLSNCSSSDVLQLCDSLLNCYLIQLLDTGFLHADPHPGNLLRTPDGKICILDFGLMSEIDVDQRIHLVEYITHLTLEDWDGVTQDLIALGFLPPTMTLEHSADIAPIMKEVMGQLIQAGGKAGISMGNISLQLEGVARQYKMVIPPYFGLILRAFSVIEGVALQHDPGYGIVAKCFPYLSRRLLTDNHPRMRKALRQLLYGNGERLDVERLQRLVAAFSSFSVGTGPAAQGPTFSDAALFEERVKGQGPPNADAIVSDSMKDALRVVFSVEGTYAQELVVEEMVAAVDALSREALGEALRLALSSNAAVTTLRSIEALGPLRAMILPMPMPVDFLSAMGSRVTLTAEDRQALTTIELLLNMMGGTGADARRGAGSMDMHSLFAMLDSTLRTGQSVMRGAGELMPIMPELLPGVQATFERFVKQLIRRMALRLADDLAMEGQSRAG